MPVSPSEMGLTLSRVYLPQRTFFHSTMTCSWIDSCAKPRTHTWQPSQGLAWDLGPDHLLEPSFLSCKRRPQESEKHPAITWSRKFTLKDSLRSKTLCLWYLPIISKLNQNGCHLFRSCSLLTVDLLNKPCTLLSTGDISVNKVDKNLYCHEAYILLRIYVPSEWKKLL